MDPNPRVAYAARVVRILHAALLAGLAFTGAVLYVVHRVSPPPFFGPSRAIAIAFGAVAGGVLVLAVGVLRPRVPDRTADQDADAYWGSAGRIGSALVLWAALEGAGVVGALGYFLTGGAAPALAFLVAVGALVLLRPVRLEGDA